jgi:hypothetical protein
MLAASATPPPLRRTDISVPLPATRALVILVAEIS